jgi:Tfp pilus assembly protein PilN
MIKQPLEQLVEELERCFDYYQEEVKEGRVESIALFGGGASLKGLNEFISNRLEVKVILGNPLQKMRMSSEIEKFFKEKEIPPHEFALAIGAALNKDKGINLLPSSIKEEKKHFLKRTSLEVIGVTFFMFLIFFYIGMRIKLNNYKKRIDVLKKELYVLVPEIKEKEGKTRLEEIVYQEPLWEDVFKELSNIFPDTIYLTYLSMGNKRLKMKGVCTSSDWEEILSTLMFNLEKGLFREVRLIMTKRLKNKVGSEFEIICEVE